jgi:RNA polymerase sigma factor (sigma-70 family)
VTFSENGHTPMKQDSDENLFQQLLSGEEKALLTLYERYRGPFIKWISDQYSLNGEDAKEIFQICMVIFYENIANEKLTSLNSSIFTYLCGIGKNKAQDWKRKAGKQSFLKKHLWFNHIVDPHEPNEKEEKEKKLELVEKGMAAIGEHCQKLLQLVYFQSWI